MKIISGFFSDAGSSRKINQDNATIIEAKYNGKNIYLGMVTDGMGGYEYGEMASKIVSLQVIRWFERKLRLDVNVEKIEKQLYVLAGQINSIIYDYGKKNNFNTGTTLSLLIIYGKRYSILNIGDSRIYELKKEVKQLTIDQSIYDENTNNGILTECLGITNDVCPYIVSGRINKKSAFLICSDGFYHMISKKIIGEYLNSNYRNEEEIKVKIKKMIKYCIVKGEKDNITALIMKVK